MYKIGDIFYCKKENDYAMLCQTGRCEVNLISLKDGNRWFKPVKVRISSEITKSEFRKLSGQFGVYKFRKVNKEVRVI